MLEEQDENKTEPRPVPAQVTASSEVPHQAEPDQEEASSTVMQPEVSDPATIQGQGAGSVEAATAAGAPVSAAVPAPMRLASVTVEDLLDLQIASDPQLSPDRSLIAFTLQRNDRSTQSSQSAIWLVPSRKEAAGGARQLTVGDYQDFAPRWSPQGDYLAFLSTRHGGQPQLFLLSLHGGEARQLTHLPNGVSEYSWRPDGQALLVHSPWKPADDQQTDPGEEPALVYTRLDEQWDGIGHWHGRRVQLWLVPLEGEVVRLTAEPVHLVQSCWSPDGSEVAFCANRRPQPDLSTSMALWVLTLATGQLRRLTPEEGLAQMPSWSPDGRYLAYYYAPDQTETCNITPWIVAADGSEAPRPVFPEQADYTCQVTITDELRPANEWLIRPQWYPDSRQLLVTIHERGQAHLYRVDHETQHITPLTSGPGRYLSPHLAGDGSLIAVVRADWFTPGDIWSLGGDGSQPQRLTGVNERFLRSHQLIRPRRLTWQATDGLTIEGWLYLPPLAAGQRAPLILAVHGGPSCAWGDAYVHEFQVLTGQGFAVLAANPRGSDGYGEAFRRRILNDWGGKDLGDLLAGLDYVISTTPIDEKRLGITGLSYGGYMTAWAITQTTRFKAAVSRNPVTYLPLCRLLSDQALWFDLAMGGAGEERLLERSPLAFIDRITTPLLLLHAGDDLRCPFSESLQLFTALRKRRQIVELVRYPGTSHTMDWPTVGTPVQRCDRLRRTLEWFQRFLLQEG
ncbi:MAG: S9 family peptidase [Thermogemmatispora sp.]|uniref:S9 family peptidase n=1 Tax=Thermogemmatispora sp. TaxID=1968838 RepID=UPI00260CD476|nr:S9 family peptidase [Thermogemmatispora sp.]MBX5455780.1 S9 family peptidase [Thermogemmatispora sp.]